MNKKNLFLNIQHLFKNKMGLLFLFFLLVHCFMVFPRYSSQIKWKEISHQKFIVVFPETYEEEAIYSLNTAQQLYMELRKLWGDWIRIPGKIKILLSDSFDESNGNATFFPYNQIEVYLFTPPPDSSIGSAKDWIRLVLSHELTHIFNLNAGSGFTYFMRKILGANPFLYPAVILPVWMTEGLAVYGESQLNKGGRLNTPDFKLMLGQILLGGKAARWSKIWGDPTPWPGGTAKYLYGAEFVDFLARTYGPHMIPKFLKTISFYSLPFTFTKKMKPIILTIHQRFRKVFGKDVSDLWEEFLQESKKELKLSGNDKTSQHCIVNFITKSGKFKRYPVFLDSDNIIFVSQNYKEYPGIYKLNISTGDLKLLIKQSGINSLYYSQKENNIYFTAVDYYKSYYRYSDIYRFNLDNNKIRKLSNGQRLFSPIKNSNDKIYCIKRKKTQSYIAIFEYKNNNQRIISRGFDSMANLAISPDERYIATSIKRKNRQWAIALFNAQGKLENILTEGYGKCYYPCWKNNHELYFVMQWRNKYCLASYNLEKDTIHIYDDSRIGAIRYFFISPDIQKKHTIASFFDTNGYNLGLFNLNMLKNTSFPCKRRSFFQRSDQAVHKTAGSIPKNDYKMSPYKWFRELIPNYINASVRKGGNEYQPGFTISSHDLPLRHSYTLSAFYGLRSQDINIDFVYNYNGFYPTLSFRYSGLSDYNQSSELGNFVHRERKFELISQFPLWFNSRNQAHFYGNIHFETVEDDYWEGSQKSHLNLNGIKVGFFFNSAKEYYDSISLTDGLRFSISYARDLKLLGSDFDINYAAFQLRKYISLSRPNVLAFNFGISDSWGEVSRLFYMGGSNTQDAYHLAGNNMFNLMRGYPAGYFVGSGGYLFNFEYRMSLLKIENVFLVFTSVERLYLSLFADVGNVWLKKWIFDPSYSLGMELHVLLYMGDFKVNVAGGMAIGAHPYHSPVIYLRLGNSF